MTQFRPGSFQILPLVIKNLLIINGLVFLAQITFDGIYPGGGLDVKTGFMSNTFALHHIFSPLFKPWQLITHMFMHGSLLHIFSNMFALWMFGSILENLWGPQRFLIFYLLCGLGAAVLHLGFLWYESLPLLNSLEAFKTDPSPERLLDFARQNDLFDKLRDGNALRSFIDEYGRFPDNQQYAREALNLVTDYTNMSLQEATLGASGAVFGCLAAFGFLFPNTYIYLYFFVPVKAKWFVLLYIGFELSMAVRNSAGDNIARWAHLGGALVGFLLVWFWSRRNKRTFY